MIKTDIVVVGGGPAGSAAATTLARNGRRVVLVDRASFPRDKCCGDGLTTAALRSLDRLGVQTNAISSWQPVSQLAIRSPSGRHVTLPMPKGSGTYAAVATRADLDAALLDLARDAGVAVMEGHSLRTLRLTDQGVVIGAGPTEAGVEIAASYAIGADGVWSPLRKAAGASEPGYLGELHAWRQYYRGVAPWAAETMWVLFEPDLLPGYAWSFPLPDGRANVGFGIHRRAGLSTSVMSELWQDLLSRPQVREVLGTKAEPDGPKRSWPIPGRVKGTQLSAKGGRVLFVGDAGRVPDPMTGEGIGQALDTAVLAAKALLEAGPAAPSNAARAYVRSVQLGLAIDNSLARNICYILQHPLATRAAIRLAGCSNLTRRHFARWMMEDYPRAVLATPWRWAGGRMSSSGAFIPA